ncbi:MAG: nucleotide exchange factor GrpE [ANME-2 cluster archaeon]|nr:nucleotide exchange factor GrpE [ANME-2 cluster archaeon]MBC2700195.1 nucleotide exchange factor GrpE [ANME-2 cluster archaeon]MBC2707190.1 nucleotide exchange factor GrpE [ANME-2 cluster archaeon]MBC2747580.1 nucleotide exchange factor GrpE [ANME-2 cluster archaeon]MBC2762893.1 nucleotide exchange factor GrpE [ANME-2 cluster archaeon]
MGKNKDVEVDLSSNDTLEDSEEQMVETEEITVEEPVSALEESGRLASEYLDHLQRLQAEFDNYKKRVDREKAELIEYASAELVSELIDIMENLERGVASAKGSDDIDSIVKGMEMVSTQLKDILGSRGLTHIEAVGKKFDPHYHEAMMMTPTDEYPYNTVIEEFQQGYTIKDRVIRYSRVRVSVNENNKENSE